MACNTQMNKRKRYCLGDFRHLISIIKADIQPADEGYDVSNDNTLFNTKAIVKTSSGITSFNGVNIDVGVSHTFIIRYVTVTIEKNYMILFNDELYRIESIEIENEDRRYIKIRASKRGSTEFGANDF